MTANVTPKPGEYWRRTADGVVVRVISYQVLYQDVGWESVKTKRRGATYLYNFLNRYELILADDVLRQQQEEFRERVTAERKRAAEEHGYTPEHDDAEGLDHLINWAIEYARQGKTIEAAGLMEAVREHIKRNYLRAPNIDLHPLT